MAWRNQRELRRNTPKALEVYKYWAKHGLPHAKDDETNYLERGTCFACGIFHTPQRAHIVPLCDGGSNTVENIHLLCKGCHALSEGNAKYWTWLTYMRKNEWKSRFEWTFKILERNGVDINEEAEKTKDFSCEDRWNHIKTLLQDNGILLTPREDV